MSTYHVELSLTSAALFCDTTCPAQVTFTGYPSSVPSKTPPHNGGGQSQSPYNPNSPRPSASISTGRSTSTQSPPVYSTFTTTDASGKTILTSSPQTSRVSIPQVPSGYIVTTDSNGNSVLTKAPSNGVGDSAQPSDYILTTDPSGNYYITKVPAVSSTTRSSVTSPSSPASSPAITAPPSSAYVATSQLLASYESAANGSSVTSYVTPTLDAPYTTEISGTAVVISSVIYSGTETDPPPITYTIPAR